MSHPALASGHVAVVTGAAQGIGLAIVRALAARGLTVAMIDANARQMSDAVATLPGVSLLPVVVDVADEGAMMDAAQRIRRDLGPVHVLVNNAGVTTRGGPWGGVDAWRRNMGINLFGVLQGQAAFLPDMIEAGLPGLVVNLGSKEGITTPPGNAAYSVAKAGVKVLTEQTAHELRQICGDRITAHLLVPGYTFTPMNFPGMSDETAKPPAPWTADQVAAAMIDAVESGRFYILCPDNEVTPELDAKRIAWAAGDMIEGRPALSRWHPDFAAHFTESASAYNQKQSYCDPAQNREGRK